MSSVTSVISLVGIGVLSGCAYTVHEYYMPMKKDNTKYKERILVLEEEIVRLKREMRICGISISEVASPPSPPSPPSPSSPPL